MDRRSFVLACGIAPLASACVSLQRVPARLDGSALVVSRAALDGKGYALVEHPTLDFPVYVHQHGPEEFSAVLTRCMHRGCTVEPGAGRLVCPCHGSEYAFRGDVLKGPTQHPLIKFPVRVLANGELHILDAVGAK